LALHQLAGEWDKVCTWSAEPMAQNDDQFRILTVIKLLDDATGQPAKLLKSFHSEIQFRRSGIA
jgi:hypothetical protein